MTSEGWRNTTWGEVAELRYGKALKGYRNRSAGVPVYGTNGPVGFTKKPLASGPAVVVGRKGAYRGVHLARTDFWVIDTAFYLEADEELVEPRWAYYSLRATDINSRDSGSAIPSLSRPDFNAIPLVLPPLDEQRAIAEVLGAFDDRIEWAVRSSELIHSCARAVAEAHESVATVPLADLADLQREMVPVERLVDEVWAHYSIPAFDEGQEPVVESGNGIRSGKYRVPPSCVLVSKLNPTWHRVWLPTSHKAWPAVCSTEFMPIVPSDEEHLALLWAALLSLNVNRQMRERVSGSTGSHQRVRPDDLMACRVADVRTFAPETRGLLDALSKRLLLLRGEVRRLAAMRDALLPQFLSGEVRVKEPSRFAGAVV